MNWIFYIICGMIVGIANIIPGVSGGTMAVVLNIYDRLIASVSNLRKEFKKSIAFLLPIAIGAGIGIVAFSKLIEFLLIHYPLATNFFFIGLILGRRISSSLSALFLSYCFWRVCWCYPLFPAARCRERLQRS